MLRCLPSTTPSCCSSQVGILDLLGVSRGGSDKDLPRADTETVREIIRLLDEIEPERARYVASFAYVLGRVAHADLEISEEEMSAIERIVADRTGLPEGQAILVVQMAKTHNQLFGGTENFLVTREFASLAKREERLALLDCLFAVSCSDDSISAVEDTEIRKIAGELRLNHSEFIEVRSRYLDYLEVLKKG